jgi:hypothetical protein
MPNEQIKSYIQQSLAAGSSKEDIKKNLLASGWQSADIEEALGAPGTPAATPASPEQPTQPKTNKKLLWIVVAVIVIIALGACAYVFLSNSHAPATGKHLQKQAMPRVSTTTITTPPATPSAPVAASCTASVPSSTTDVQGTVTSVDSSGRAQKLTDDCLDAATMEKFFCYESPVGSGHYASGRKVVDCPNGCVNGACQK